MYQKVLVPLDDSEDSRSVIKALSGLVAEDGEEFCSTSFLRGGRGRPGDSMFWPHNKRMRSGDAQWST